MVAPVQFASTFNEQAQVSVRGSDDFAMDKNMNQVFCEGEAMTVTLPLDAPDGHRVQILATGGGAVTVAAPVGQTIGGTTGHDTVAANSSCDYTLDASTLTWISDGGGSA